MSLYGIDLGLGRMRAKRTTSVCSDLIDFYEACSELQDKAHDLGRLMYAYKNLNNITKCIKKYGVTRSLEVLYGDSFSSSYAMEKEAETAKQTVVEQIKNKLELVLNQVDVCKEHTGNMVELVRSAIAKAKFTKPFTFTGVSVNNSFETKDISVKNAGAFRELVDAYRKAINTEINKQFQIKKDITAAITELSDNNFEQQLVSITNNIRLLINALINLANGVGSPIVDTKKDDEESADIMEDFDMDEASDDTSKPKKKDKEEEDAEEESDKEDDDDKDESKSKSKKDDDKDDDKKDSEDDSEKDDDKKKSKKDDDKDEDDEESEEEDDKDSDDKDDKKDKDKKDDADSEDTSDEEVEELEEDDDKDDKKSKKGEETKDFLDLF